VPVRSNANEKFYGSGHTDIIKAKTATLAGKDVRLGEIYRK